MMWGYGLNWLSMTLMMLGSIVALGLLVVLVWAVMCRQKKRTTSLTRPAPIQPVSGPPAREILSQRYARGEIDTATFEQMRERLEASDSAPPRRRVEGRNPVGESLFDGITPGSGIL